MVRGSATFGLGESVVTVSAGELIAFPPGLDHAVLDSSPDLYLYALGVSPSCPVETLSSQPCLPVHVQLSSAELGPIVEQADALVDKVGADSLAADLWGRVHGLARRSSPRSLQGTHVLTRRALQLVRRAPDLPLHRVATELRAHPTEVSRLFHRDMGITLVRYRTRLKVLHLIRVMDDTSLDLMSAASHAGFGSYSQCHRSFQAELGCSPRQFFFDGLRDGMQQVYSDQSVPASFP